MRLTTVILRALGLEHVNVLALSAWVLLGISVTYFLARIFQIDLDWILYRIRIWFSIRRQPSDDPIPDRSLSRQARGIYQFLHALKPKEPVWMRNRVEFRASTFYRVFPVHPSVLVVDVDIPRSSHSSRGVRGCMFMSEDHIDTTSLTTVIFAVHGGGYISGSPSTNYRHFYAQIARESRVSVFAVDYPLAPESSLLEIVQYVADCYEWLILEKGANPRRVSWLGDSAGGGLALLALIEVRKRTRENGVLRQKGLRLPYRVGLLSPWVDLSEESPSFEEMESEDPLLHQELGFPVLDMLRGDIRLQHPNYSPLYADLSGLPPTSIQVGEFEVLRDDSMSLHTAMTNSNVESSLKVRRGLWHVYHLWHHWVPEAKEDILEMIEFLLPKNPASSSSTSSQSGGSKKKSSDRSSSSTAPPKKDSTVQEIEDVLSNLGSESNGSESIRRRSNRVIE